MNQKKKPINIITWPDCCGLEIFLAKLTKSWSKKPIWTKLAVAVYFLPFALLKQKTKEINKKSIKIHLFTLL